MRWNTENKYSPTHAFGPVGANPFDEILLLACWLSGSDLHAWLAGEVWQLVLKLCPIVVSSHFVLVYRTRAYWPIGGCIVPSIFALVRMDSTVYAGEFFAHTTETRGRQRQSPRPRLVATPLSVCFCIPRWNQLMPGPRVTTNLNA